MPNVSIDAFTSAVKYVARRTGDPDLAQNVALYAWERLGECRGKPRPWMLAIAWQMRRAGRKRTYRDIQATERYTEIARLTRPHELPEQEQAVLWGELSRRRDLSPISAPEGRHTMCVARARSRAGELLAS